MGLITPQGEVLQQGWAYLQPGEHFEFTQWTLKFVVRAAPDICAFQTDFPARPDLFVAATTVDATLRSWGSSGRMVVFWNNIVLKGTEDPETGLPSGLLTLELAAENVGPGGRVNYSLYFQEDLDASEVTG